LVEVYRFKRQSTHEPMKEAWNRLVDFLVTNKLLNEKIDISFEYDINNGLHSYVLRVWRS